MILKDNYYNLNNQDTISSLPLLVKGYIINHIDKVYYGHFWVEYNECIYDVATETLLKDYPEHKHNDIKNNRRVLVKTIPENLKHRYRNMDSAYFEQIRNESYLMCMENKFLEDVKENVPPESYKKIKSIYDKLIY